MTRKLLTLTLAALAFGATQAANINWETAVSATSSAGSSDQYIDVYAGAAATVAASITYGTSIGTGTVLSIGASLDNKTFSVQIGENGVYTLTAHGANGTPTITTVGSATAVANATQTVALSIVRGSNQSTTVILSVGGVEVAKIENHNIGTGPIKWTEWGRRVGNQDAYSGNATYTVFTTKQEVDAATIASEVDNLLNPDPEPDPSVPEPTALALLALGVAGVALRRRVA